MLSNKMTVSLVTIVLMGIALLAPTASNAVFEITLKEVKTDASTPVVYTNGDISHADGNQVGSFVEGSDAFDMTLVLEFGKAVRLEADDIEFAAYNKNDSGVYEYEPRVPASLEADDFSVGAEDAANTVIEVAIPIGSAATPEWEADRLIFRIPAGSVVAANPLDTEANKAFEVTIDILKDDPDATPQVYIIEVADRFNVPTIEAESFQVRVLLSEEPRGGFTKDLLDVSEATVAGIQKVVPTLAQGADLPEALHVDLDDDGNEDDGEQDADASWRDEELHEYLVTLTPNAGEKTVTVKVKNFDSMELPGPGDAQEVYTQPATLVEGRHMLTVKTKRPTVTTAKLTGTEVKIPKEKRIPKDGYFIVAKKSAESGIKIPDGSESKDEPKVDKRTPAQLLYNVHERTDLPNLETFLLNGGTIDLIGPENVVISEIMWGTDASLSPNSVNSQWIEIRNLSGKSLQTGDGNYKFVFYGPNETPRDRSGAKDRVGTLPASGYWAITGKGQAGRSGAGDQSGELLTAVGTDALVSMQRVFTGNTPADGELASSWASSVRPAVNFDPAKVGDRVGSPGAAPSTYPEPPPPAPEPVPEPVIPVATAGQIAITEIMVDTADGRLPQWIELTNTSAGDVRLTGWSLDIANDATDANAVGTSLRIDLSDAMIGADAKNRGLSLLLVAWAQSARRSSNLQDAGVAARVMDVAGELNQRSRYTLLSESAFKITLVPPQSSGITLYGDSAGNLGAATAWELPMAEGGQRSSLIRVQPNKARQDGTQADSWVLADGTALTKGPLTWFGSDEDAGTPGYVGGGPLPVQLSRFSPARDRVTGAVVISWETQSELNNAGFYIKRSQQRHGEFTVINATMVPGAGTTSEKQTYTYTDTTAAPNIVYYYQIEEVSLDGQRLTLTQGTRLRGHISAAGKATTTWGDLKTAHE